MSLRRRTGALLGLLTLALGAAASEHKHPATPSPAGEAIYLRGVLGSGAALQGTRSGGLTIQGVKAACVNCHRRSGLGATEGSVTIPPITGEYLYHERASPSSNEHPLMYVENAHGNRDPYTDATLARAIRAGLNSQGQPLSVLMPRFDLGDADMSAVIDYLKGLDRRHVLGCVGYQSCRFSDHCHFPMRTRRSTKASSKVLNQYFADKNLFPFAPQSAHAGPPARPFTGKSMYVANRRWQLHVWELSGPAATWKAQLEQDFAREPVMAVIPRGWVARIGPPCTISVSGNMCRACFHGTFDAPSIPDTGDFYTVYLSRGVLLEAGLIADELSGTGDARAIRTVRQVYRRGDSGEAAAWSLAAALQAHGITVLDEKLPPVGKPGETLAQALKSGPADAWVLWLRPADLATLGAPPAEPSRLFVSGLLGGLEQAPAAGGVRGGSGRRLTYPVDLPDKRVVRVDYPLGWFRLRHVEVVDARVQSDTYLACGILAETLHHMADIISPEYLVEQLQETLEHRILQTGYYPRLSLAPGQTVGSKGAYWVRLRGCHRIAGGTPSSKRLDRSMRRGFQGAQGRVLTVCRVVVWRRRVLWVQRDAADDGAGSDFERVLPGARRPPHGASDG